MIAKIRPPIIFVAFLAFVVPAGAQTTADLILHNGNVHTVDLNNTNAQAVAVRGGRIIAVGSNADILAMAGPATQKIDVGGKTVLPGIIDSHVHVERVGIQRVCTAVSPRGTGGVEL